MAGERRSQEFYVGPIGHPDPEITVMARAFGAEEAAQLAGLEMWQEGYAA